MLTLHIQRGEMFESVMTSAKESTYIFTDQQSSDEIGSATAREYADAARKRNSVFFSIILHCEFEENLRRLQAADRCGATNTKLTDTDIFRSIRKAESIYHFGRDELSLDISNMSATQAARQIYEFVQVHLDQETAQEC